MPLLRGAPPPAWRRFVFSEYDFSMQEARRTLGRGVNECRLFMVFDGRWKMIHAPGLRPMLFDLETDPQELRDLGADAGYAGEAARLRAALLDWALKDHNRITTPDAAIEGYGPAAQVKAGIFIGYVDEAEVAEAKKAYGLT